MNATPLRPAGLAAAFALALAACENPLTKEQTSTGRTVATLTGTIASAVVGNRIGQKLDEADRIKAGQALESSPTGRASSWKNRNNGNTYTFTPTRTVQTSDGPCRDFTMVGTIDAKSETANGTACRQPDGSWKSKG